MNLSRSLRRGVVLAALLALAAPLAVGAGNGKGGYDRGHGRVFYATDTANTLLRFSSDRPHKLRAKHITDLPVGVSIKGIDFRPASGDLYAARQQQGRVPAEPEDGHRRSGGPDLRPSALDPQRRQHRVRHALRTLVFVQICANCGEENPARFRLCGFCGTQLAPDLAPRETRKTVTIVFSDLKSGGT
jgi:hypothetical protein